MHPNRWPWQKDLTILLKEGWNTWDLNLVCDCVHICESKSHTYMRITSLLSSNNCEFLPMCIRHMLRNLIIHTYLVLEIRQDQSLTLSFVCTQVWSSCIASCFWMNRMSVIHFVANCLPNSRSFHFLLISIVIVMWEKVAWQ